ncbi:leukocyte elastase inhibitor [Anabrus simplex]|uniref:leukocyte elastase inhibitor n=1 Tax=Anabrus simplex TaxID=316456 RepID=UPI0035A3B59C
MSTYSEVVSESQRMSYERAMVVWYQLSAVNSNERAQSGKGHNEVVQSINDFSISLYQVLSEEPGNIAVSPFSLEVSLASLLVGSRGDTAKRLSAALHLPLEHSRLEQAFSTLLALLKNSENATLEIANKIYIHKDFKVKDQFFRSTKQHFKSVVEHNTEAVRTAIDTWAAEKSHIKIQNLPAPDALKSNDVMVLGDDVCFKGFWKYPFDKKLTQDTNFHCDNQSSVTTQMMHLTENLGLAEIKEWRVRILKLPYRGQKYSMLVLLPDDIDGLRKLETRLHTLNISHILKNLKLTEVALAFPRFLFGYIMNSLEAPLQKLGVAELFIGGDFSGMSNERLALIQQIYVRNEEKGTGFAGFEYGPDVFARTSKVVRPPREFIADHPFTYMFIEEEKGTIMIIGRVKQPSPF